MSKTKDSIGQSNSNGSLYSKEDFVEIPNPYHPYDYKSGRAYYNKEVVEKLKRLLNTTPPHKIIFIQGKEGSGKSSTLKYLKNDPAILGVRCIPIYVDLGKTLQGPRDNLLLRLYEKLKESVDKYRFPFLLEKLDTIKEDTTLKDIYHFFKTLEIQKDSEALILLIFDDFDKVFELEKTGDFFPVIEFFKKLSAGNDQYRVLLSRSGEIPESIKYTKFGECLKNIARIKMDVSDLREFFELIEAPVKDRVTYLPPALKEIRRITGGNLYCQHLICHYIILHLNFQEKEICDKEDAAAAVELSIKDRRVDFEYSWKMLRYEEKMVCSAIVDDHIVSIREIYYFIEPGSLLEQIFDPIALNEILNRLYNNGFIYKTLDGRRFEAFPFKIPLFGLWVKKRYPFVNMVVENIETIARQKDFFSLGKIVEKIPKEFFPAKYSTTIECIQKWFELKNLMEEKTRVDREKTGNLVKVICKTLGLSVREASREEVDYFIINFEDLNIGSIKEAFFLIQDRLQPSQSDIQHFVDIIVSDVKSFRPSIFFCFKKNERIKELEGKSYLNIILVEEEDLKNIFFSSEWPSQIFKEFLLQRLSTSQISPYQTEGPAITNFYGRLREIERIMSSSSKSFVIVGARRIGKSSLIMRAKTELDNLGVHCIYMDLEFPSNPDYKTFLASLELEFERCFKKKFHFNNNLNNFVLETKKLNWEKKRFVIILDEIDELLKFDRANGYELIKALRRLFHEHCCQVILSGFEVLYNSKRERQSPLYNFGEEKPLGPLEKRYALDLITEPLANIGITYNDPADKELILDYTSSHPNLLQFFCKHLIEKIAERERNRRIIFRDDIGQLFNSEYETYIINDFYMFYEDLDNLEKLFVLLFVDCNPEETDFSIAFINEKLETMGINILEARIHRTLQKLKLRFILIDKGEGKYVIALPHFPSILRKRNDPNLLKRLIERVKEGNYEKSL